jgi:hypothetical protein
VTSDLGFDRVSAATLGQAVAVRLSHGPGRTGAGMVLVFGLAGLSACSGNGTFHPTSASKPTTTSITLPPPPTSISEASQGPASIPAPCPKDSDTPSMATGIYCGPSPTAGNGLGPGGECDGKETFPPCGMGVVVGTSYAYTQPQDCAGNPIHFDGRLWYSTLQPSSNLSDTFVWMALEPDDQVEAISPTKAIGYKPDIGQAPSSTCK